MIEYFVIIVHVNFNMKYTDWVYDDSEYGWELSAYPPNELIEKAMKIFSKEAQVFYARVEKRYKLT